MSKKKFTKKAEEKPIITASKTVKSSAVLTPADPEKKIRRNIYYLIFIVSFLLYGNTIPNEYAMDDELVTLDHPLVGKGISAIPEIMTSRYVQNDQQSYEYRPIVQVTYAIEHQFTGGNVHFSHFINILLYALTGVLLFQLLSQMFISSHWILPASITLLFLFHPIHSEVVASLKNRDELLSFLFSLLTIRSALNYFDQQKWVQLVYGALFFVLAIISKKSAIPLIVTLPLILYFFRNVSLKRALIFYIIPVIILFAINFIVNNGLENVNRPGLYFENPYYVDKPSLIERIPMAFYSMGYYVKMLILPYPLLVYYGYSHIEIEGWANPLTIASVLFFIGGAIYCFKNLSKKNIGIFGFLFFGVNVFAFSNIIPMPGIIADRFIYAGSLGFSILVCYLVFKLLKVNTEKNASLSLTSPMKIGMLTLFLVCNIYIFQRNKDWKDHLTIYLADVEYAPQSAKLNALIGGYCMQTLEKIRLGKSEKKYTSDEINEFIYLSKKHFNAALKVYPDYIACLNNMGTVYYSYLGNQDSAFIYFDKVLKLDPHHVQANFNIGSYYETKFTSFSLMQNQINGLPLNDSTDTTIVVKDKKYSKYISEVQNLYRTAGMVYADISKTFQQFINDNRSSNGQVDHSIYINTINEYWSRLITKYEVDASLNLNPGNEFIQTIVQSTTTNQSEFTMILQNMVQNTFLKQVQGILEEKFKTVFNRQINSTDLKPLLEIVTKERKINKEKMIRYFSACHTKEKMYPLAFQKLATIYTEQKMWDSLIVMNKRALKSDETSRFVDVYRMMGTAYFYSDRQNEGIKYFEMSIAEEEKILRKAEASIRYLSAAGNNFAVQKMNQLIFSSRNNLSTLIMNLGAMYNAMGNEDKANECLKRSQNYQI